MGKKGVVVAAGVLAAMTVMSGVIAEVFTGWGVGRLPAENGGSYCDYWISPGMPMSVAAAALALTTQVLASTAIGCYGAWRNVPSQTRRVVAILLFFGSWVLTIKVVILFLVGSMLGFSGYASNNIVEKGSCIAPVVEIFTAAIILFLIVVCLDIASYTLVQKDALDSEKAVGLEKPPSGIATGATGAAKC